MKRLFTASAVMLAASAAPAQNPAWIHGPKPIFVPGLYESESRNSHFQNQPAKATVCIASADFDAFRADTMAQYRSAPHFSKECSLSETAQMTDGFALAMACRGVKTVLTYRFSKDQVASTIETIILQHRASSSSILTMMRRVGDCPGQKAPV
ncbi:hypothetical protein [Bradyrhizobium sp. LHD-71]|uniref:hypothetical protein n=1 Tax=Bradyrhizobium sp. LHD-71 TaxID=3072141 RepID=UPI00280C8343|nr:hypothetical protein [Bradyrhizobium sp. LHD-71]MDQ8728924.1 hypothetical protein [Bradyrhizobium sp. LHD-71]